MRLPTCGLAAGMDNRTNVAVPVMLHTGSPDCRQRQRHEVASLAAIGRRIARLLGAPYCGWGCCGRSASGSVPTYLVASDALLPADAARYAISRECQFFGGIVPYPWVAGKAIVHPLHKEARMVPEGWTELGEGLISVTAPGFSAFCAEDAERAGRQLLAQAPVIRVKPAWCRGGMGQQRVSNPASLQTAIAELDGAGLQAQGVVLEVELAACSTYSVGSVQFGPHRFSYIGMQFTTVDLHGRNVYGGSDLWMERGDLQRLQACVPSRHAREVIGTVIRFDALVRRAYPQVLVSRCNYDVAVGLAPRRCVAVLEQSWRVGGASTAEVSGADALLQHPEVDHVRSQSCEDYGRAAIPPPGAEVYWRGRSNDGQQMTKYSVVNLHGRTG